MQVLSLVRTLQLRVWGLQQSCLFFSSKINLSVKLFFRFYTSHDWALTILDGGSLVHYLPKSIQLKATFLFVFLCQCLQLLKYWYQFAYGGASRFADCSDSELVVWWDDLLTTGGIQKLVGWWTTIGASCWKSLMDELEAVLCLKIE